MPRAGTGLRGRMMTRRALAFTGILFSLALTLFASNLCGRESISLAVLAYRPRPWILARWQPTADYLSARTGRHFVVEALTYLELEQAINQRRVDFILTNPAHYVLMTRRNGLTSPLATLTEIEHGEPLSRFGGVIVTLPDRLDISELRHLKGKRVATPDIGSFGGFQMQAYELSLNGISATEELDAVITGMPHDNAIRALLENRADAAFIRTGVIEGMVQSGLLNASQLRVIGRRYHQGFPFLISTRLYPEWPIAAMPHTDQVLARKVATALFAIRPEDAPARLGHYHGWAVPADYESVRDLLQELRLPPYDQAPRFTIRDELHKHGAVLLLTTLSVILLVLLVLFIRRKERELHNQEMQQSEERKQLLAALGEGVFGVDLANRCRFINPVALAMLGFSEQEMLSSSQHELIHHHHADGSPYADELCPIHQTLTDGQKRISEEWFFRKDGSRFPVEITVTPVTNQGVRSGAVVVFRDISARKHMEAELHLLATTDPLTELPNRRQFLAVLEIERERLDFDAQRTTSLLMIDLDHFKRINDEHGHATGDRVLRDFAILLQNSLRKGDIAGRLGGEEFAVLLTDCPASGARDFAERLRSGLESHEVILEHRRIRTTISIGIARLLRTDERGDRALARADLALYRAKELGRNRIEVSHV